MFQKGISYVSWHQGQYLTPNADQSLRRLADTGANWIALIVTGYQETITSTEISRHSSKTPTDADLVHTIVSAHKLGLKTLLKPHIDVNNPAYWRGQIGIGFTSEAEWQSWFASYGDFINHYATLAEENQVGMLSIGTELKAVSSRDYEWRQILQAVRHRFSGKVVYASNWDESARDWWAETDFIGIDAYFPLKTDSEKPSVEELKAAWASHVTKLEKLHQRYGRPVIITEIGYRSINKAHIAPYNWQTDAAANPTEQANLYKAALEIFCDDKDWLAGIYWWNWLVDPNQGGLEDTDYTPYNKPAEEVLKEYYQAGWKV